MDVFPLPECATAPPAARRRYLVRSGGYTAVFLILLYAALILGAGGAAKAVLVAGALVALSLGLWEFVVLLRALDELQQAIHVRALAVGLGVSAALTTLGALAAMSYDLAIDAVVPAALVIPAAAVIYYVALFFMARRYR